MSKVALLKAGVGFLVSSGTGAIVGNIVRATLPENVSKFNKVCIAVGGVAISGVVGAAATSHVDEQIDKVVGLFKKKDEKETKPDADETPHHEVIFKTEDEAERVLGELISLVNIYGKATIADLKELAGVGGLKYPDHIYGWEDLSEALTARVTDGYVILLPKAGIVKD